MSRSSLQSIGLSSNEETIYNLLIKLGEVPVSTIISQSKLKRPTAYDTLYSLEKKGLISKREIKKKIHFSPESPVKLLEIAESHYQNMDRVRADLRTIVPQLSSLYITSVEKPIVRTYEGLDGIKEIYMDTLKEKKPIYAVLQTDNVNQDLLDWLINYYSKKRTSLKIHARAIVASGRGASRYRKRDKSEYRITIEVTADKFPFAQEVNIYGDKVAFINYKKGEALIGIVIKHPQIAQTMKAWFDLAWTGAISKNYTTSLSSSQKI